MTRTNPNSSIVCIGTSSWAFPHSELQARRKLSSPATHWVKGDIKTRSYLPDFIRPTSIFLVALAAAVTLWGFAYKLSLYDSPQNHPSHLSVAKMWLGTERQSGVITGNAATPHFWPAPAPQCDLANDAMPHISFRQVRWAFPATIFIPTGSSFRVGSRSPPSRVLSMRSRVVA